MLNPIVKLDISTGTVVLDLEDVYYVGQTQKGIYISFRGGNDVELALADWERSIVLEDLYAKMRKIREDKIALMGTFTYE